MRLHVSGACVWHEMQRPSWRNFDPILLAVSILLVGYGLLVIASATRVTDVSTSPALIRQTVIGGVGVIVMIGLSFVDYRAIGQIAPILYIFMLVALVFVLILGTFVAGAQRWLDVAGIRIQPSELAKLIIVICMARFFAGRTKEPTPSEVRANPLTGMFAEHVRTNLVALAIVAPAVVLVYLQPDLGTTLVLIASYFSVAYFAGVPYAILGGLASVPLLGFPVVWQVMKPYMRRRITSFLSPDRDPLGEGYNLIQARISVGSGGWWGRGLGNGTQTQLNFLRVQHTDFRVHGRLRSPCALRSPALAMPSGSASFSRCVRSLPCRWGHRDGALPGICEHRHEYRSHARDGHTVTVHQFRGIVASYALRVSGHSSECLGSLSIAPLRRPAECGGHPVRQDGRADCWARGDGTCAPTGRIAKDPRSVRRWRDRGAGLGELGSGGGFRRRGHTGAAASPVSHVHFGGSGLVSPP
ncbi:MAG: rod shape-determining protein RodA [Chloroflexi bacterium]|nr:rod shape-determining protein RodA [Chloroflexota bacterium]